MIKDFIKQYLLEKIARKHSLLFYDANRVLS